MQIIYIFNSQSSSNSEVKVTEAGEESDGISVISENDTKVDEAAVEQDQVDSDDAGTSDVLVRSHESCNNAAVTTDDEEQHQENYNKIIRPFKSLTEAAEVPNYLLLGAVLIVIFGVCFALTVSFINSLKSDIEFLRDKVHVLEEDNRMLMKIKSELTSQQQPSPPDVLMRQKQQQRQQQPEKPLERPKTKTVFNGESEESIQILDKENQIPDFCYFTDESDLFAEYNKELCDRLRSKQKKQPKSKKSKKSRTKTESDYLQQKSADSIHRDIETSRKNISDRVKKSKKSKNKQQQPDDSWMDQRAKSREQIRQSEKYRDDNDENWYLRRRADKFQS